MTEQPSTPLEKNLPILDQNAPGEWLPTPLERLTWDQLGARGRISIEQRRPLATGPAAMEDGESEAKRPKNSAESGKGGASWVRVPTPPSLPSNTQIWHYTDTHGFMGILKSRTLWATSLDFLNDRSEASYGLHLFQESLEDVKASKFIHPLQKDFLKIAMDYALRSTNRTRIFVSCCSTAKDSLAQWRSYSGGGGYSLAFNPSSRPQVLTKSDDLAIADAAIVESWRKVIYVEGDQKKLVNDTLNFLVGLTPNPDMPNINTELERRLDTAIQVLLTNSCYMKHPAFAEEKEARLIMSVNDAVDREDILYRPTAYGVAPYLAIALDSSDHRGTVPTKVKNPSSLPLLEVLLGPGEHEESRKSGATAFMKSLGYNVPVNVSAAPYR